MALSHVQTTAKQTASSTGTLTITFASRPTVGNALVVCVNRWGTSVTLTCADNQGGANTYSEVVTQHNATGNGTATLLICPQVVTSAGTFTLTVTGAGFTYWVGAAVEIGGLAGGTLVTDRTVSAIGTSTTPATGATAALTKNEVMVIAQHAIGVAEGSITVQVVSPTWTEVFEELPFSLIAGESDRRILTSAAGTTTSCAWTDSASGGWAAVLAAFGTTAAAVAERSEPFIVYPV